MSEQQIGTVHGQVASTINNHTGDHGTYVTVVNIHVHAPGYGAPLHGNVRASSAHRRALALLDRVPDRIAVLDFMEREFGTRMVIELDTRQLYRLRRYVEVILAAPRGG